MKRESKLQVHRDFCASSGMVDYIVEFLTSINLLKMTFHRTLYL